MPAKQTLTYLISFRRLPNIILKRRKAIMNETGKKITKPLITGFIAVIEEEFAKWLEKEEGMKR